MAAPTNASQNELCFLISNLPLEIRLHVYEYLVVADTPLLGKVAHDGKDKSYGLDLAILRVNRQIHHEASAIFYGKNTFRIASTSAAILDKSWSSSGSTVTNDAGSIDSPQQTTEAPPTGPSLDPPLPPTSWPLLRQITIDLLYHARSLPDNSEGDSEIDFYDRCIRRDVPGCAAYFSTLTSLLTSASATLLSLGLTVNMTHPTFKTIHNVILSTSKFKPIMSKYTMPPSKCVWDPDSSTAKWVVDYSVPSFSAAIAALQKLPSKDLKVKHEFEDAFYETEFWADDKEKMFDCLHPIVGRLIEARLNKELDVIFGRRDADDGKRVDLKTVTDWMS